MSMIDVCPPVRSIIHELKLVAYRSYMRINCDITIIQYMLVSLNEYMLISLQEYMS